MGNRDPQLLRSLKEMPCFICGARPSDPHHIRTRGSGGGDEPNNMLPLCRMHHVEIHRIGVKSFAERYRVPIDFSGIYPKLEFEWKV